MDGSVDSGWQEKVRENIRSGAELNSAFIFMNILATMIACYGLFANSPAVIIGAMIVAMLLGPIAGTALSLVDNDKKLLRRSLCTLTAGTITVMTASFVIGFLHRDIPVTGEIMSRTAPNLIDLMVALAGGAAGAYASVSPRLSIALVGVAIATALVPPLCSASILFAHGEARLGLGALLLTFTNMVAIQFASSAVLWLTGFRKISRAAGLSFLGFFRSNVVSILILLILAFFLTVSLHKAIAHKVFQTKTEYTLRDLIDGHPGSHLAEVRFETNPGKESPGVTIVRAVMRGPSPPAPAQVEQMEKMLPNPPDNTSIELRIRFVETRTISKDGLVYKEKVFGSE